MAEITPEPEKGPNGRRRSRAKRTERKAETRKRRSSAKKKALREEAAAGDGAEQLKQAAEKAIGKNSKKIAEVLLQKTMDGDISSVKLLLTLAEGTKATKEDEARRERKKANDLLLRRLETEPQWEGDEPEDWEDE